MSKLKGLARDSVLYGVGEGVGRLTSILLVPVLSRIFAPADYGVIDLLTAGYAFTLLAVRINVLTGLQRFYFKSPEELRPKLVASASCGLIVLACIVATVISAVANKISLAAFETIRYGQDIAILAWCLPFETLFNILILLLRLNRMPITFPGYQLGRLVNQVALTYVLVIFTQAGVTGVFVARAITLVMICWMLMLRQRNEFCLKVDMRLFEKVVRYSVPGFPGRVMSSIMDFLPLYILSCYGSLTAVGLYGMANKMCRLIRMYVSSFNRAWSPFAFANAGEEDEKILYEKVFTLYGASLMVIGVVVSIFAEEIITIIAASSYHSSHELIPGICLYMCIVGMRPILSTGLYSKNRVRHTSYLSLILLVTFGSSSWLLVPLFAAKGLIVSLDIAAGVYIACYMTVVKRYVGYRYGGQRLALLLILGIITVCTVREIHGIETISLIGKICVAAIYGGVVYHYVIGRDERTKVRERIWLIYEKGINTVEKRS